MRVFEGTPITTKRSKRKTVSIQVLKDENNQVILLIKIPVYVDDEQLKTILDAKRSWIRKSKDKLLKIETTKNKLLSDYSLKENGRLPFKGNCLKIEFLTDRSIPKMMVKGDEERISIIRNPNYSYHRIELPRLMLDYYREKAYEEFKGIIDAYSNQFHFKVNKLRIKDTKTRWGSCSAKLNINLNWKLIITHHRVYEYVIVHELCHIGCWNHSQQFWNRVAAILPDYKSRKEELKQISGFLAAFDFSKLETGS
ncbi:MAG: M48 family metallopeptidase [Thermotogota bacterium]